jgi:membrane associated rhomboid family serine protease
MTNNQFRPGGFSILPPVVKNLLIINGLAFLAFTSLSNAGLIDLNDVCGLHCFGSEKFQPFQLITYMFMHGDWSHIFFNMLALWFFGSALENHWGPKRFLIFYLITGVGAAILHYSIIYFEIKPILYDIDNFLAHPSNPKFIDYVKSANFIPIREIQINFENFRKTYNELIISDQGKALDYAVAFIHDYRANLLNTPVIIGASGSIFGLLLGFGMLFPNALIYLYFIIPVKAKWFVIIFGALELWAGFSPTPGDHVGHFAHLGGMIFGFILIKIWKKKDINRWT